MFGTNQIVGKSFFKDMEPNTLMVTSVFYTFQGEGPYSGMPAVFVRLSKCNLACSFCDSQFEQGQVMTFDELFTKINEVVRKFWTDKGQELPWVMAKNVESEGRPPLWTYGFGLVITGGEPTIQSNLRKFLLQVEINGMFLWNQIESNGIVTQDLPSATTVVVSPKCAEKEGKPTQYLTPSKEMLERANCLKFVMSSPENGESPYNEIPAWAHKWKQENGKDVYVSPMNVYKEMPKAMRMLLNKEDKTMEERSTSDEVVSFWESGVLDMEANRRNHEYAAQYAMTHGFRFQVQTHLFASVA